jgi:hypothetical protein
VTRSAITFLLPSHLAFALTQAAKCAGTLDAEGRIVMDHIILAKPDSALATQHLQPSEPRSEAHFNGA